MRFSMLYSEQILSFKSCLVFYAGDSLRLPFKSLFCNLHELATKYEKITQFQRGPFFTLNALSPLSLPVWYR